MAAAAAHIYNVCGEIHSAKMSARSADTAGERGRAVDALFAASATQLPSTPWSSAHKSRNLNVTDSRKHGGCSSRDGLLSRHDCHRSHHHQSNEAAADKAKSEGGTTTFDGDDDLVGAVDHLLNSDSGRGQEPKDGLDLCSSTWKSVESMTRALAAGQSIMSTISRCYSLPGLAQDSSPPAVAVDLHRSARETGTEMMHSSLASGRFAARALAIFRRLGQAPPTQPDCLYINSSKLAEAAKALDPGVDEATIRAWMKANGFKHQEQSKESLEALSWTEYRQALSELSPAFRRHGITFKSSGEPAIATMTPVEASRLRVGSGRHADPPSSRNNTNLANQPCRDRWEDVVDRKASCASFPPQRYSVVQSEGDNHRQGDGFRDCPPRSPGADSYGVLRRKRHAAVSLDYEAITKHLPQVIQPLDPSILVDHIKAHGRRERKNPGSDVAGLSLWSLDPHDRLTKMPLQKDQVSETANPRLVQPRHAAVQVRSRRSEFGRRREAEAGLVARLARNAGVIGRQAKIAESKLRERDRQNTDHDRVESQRAAETKRSVLVREAASHRARERRLKMEMLKSCIAQQLRAIQENEDRVMARVREKRHVLRKGEGIHRIDTMKRARSSPTIGQAQVFQHVRQPFLTATVPPADQDARWVYSRGNELKRGSPKRDGPTVSLPNCVFTQPARPDGSGRPAVVDPSASRPEQANERTDGGTITEKSRSEQQGGEGDVDEASSEGKRALAGRWRARSVDSTEERQARSRETGGAEQRMKRCSSNGGVRLRTSSRTSNRSFRVGGATERDGFLQTLQKPRNIVTAAKSNRTRAAFGFGSREDSKADTPASFLSVGSPSVSPWCRQATLSAEWDDAVAAGVCDEQDRGVLGWADDASGSNDSRGPR